MLIAAAVVSAAIGDLHDAFAIAAIVVLNSVLGFTQEFRAEPAMRALKQLAVPHVRVRRDGLVREVSARELVPGDVMLLEAGNVVAADARVVEAANLRLQEAALTGESETVSKHAGPIDGRQLPVGDRRNMVFMGTSVGYGRGAAIVTGTGMQTELGVIAATMQDVRRDVTPLERRLDALGRTLALAALGIVSVVFVLGLVRGEPLRLMFLTAVSMAVAAVPEGLPAVVTIALALGAQRMLRRRAPDPKAFGRGNAWRRHGDLFRQDRNADRKPDAGHRTGGFGTACRARQRWRCRRARTGGICRLRCC